MDGELETKEYLRTYVLKECFTNQHKTEGSWK